MLALDRQTAAASRSGNQPPIQLRFRADGRVVEIPVGKTTVGSSPRCNLRIEKPGVQPVHCLIVNGLDGLTVRRWAPNTLLNGAAFDEAPFADGDCLTVAEVELELVSSQAEVEQPAEWLTTPTIASNELLDTVQQSVDEMAELEAANSEAEALEIGEVGSAPNSESAKAIAEPVVDEEPDTVLDEVPAETEELSALAAAEIVFQDLQAACANSRGRSRKLLAALRSKQENYSELAERLTEVEAQLAELRKLRNEWDETHFGHDAERQQWESQLRELRQQLDECEVRLADYAQQMVELREELATVRSHEATIAEVTGIESEDDESSTSSEVVDWLPVSKATQPLPEDAITDSYPAESEHDEQRSGLADFYDVESEREPEPTRNWESQLMSEAWRLADARPSESASEPQAADNLADVEYASEEEPTWQANTAAPELTPSVETASEEDNPFSQFSIWKQGIFRDSPNHEEPVAEEQVSDEPVSEPSSAPIWASEYLRQEAAEPAEEATVEATQVDIPAVEQRPSLAAALEQPTVEQADTAPPQPEQASYLERYSHLFAEENAAAAEPVAPVPPPVVIHTPPPSLSVSHEAPEVKLAGGDEEESIEQYMAKLLQRVRRDVSASAPPEAKPTAAAKHAVIETPPTAQPVAVEETAPVEPAGPMSEEDAERELSTWRSADRKAAAPVSDLGALRAIANQTARRAISRHQLARHKRDATTKVIVAALAGVTSLWLMIRAESWHDMQFIAACGSLLVAACWAGKAFREMLRSWKAAARHGTGNLLADSGEHHHAGLPIDVEDRF